MRRVVCTHHDNLSSSIVRCRRAKLAATSLQQCWRWRAGRFPKLSNQSKFEIDDALLVFLHTNREHLYMYLTKQSADALTESTHTLVVPYSSTRPLPVRPPPPITTA